ncbi:MAG: FG-GAP repeat protein [Phycisphaerae bacterium]|nr:FG-GAP repeat protein [Phycisphaerae bacterium]
MSFAQHYRPGHRARAVALSFAAALALTTVGHADTLVLKSLNEETTGKFGFSVAGIPDCNGDGVDDVIIGAPGENGGGVNDAGRVYIHSGATGELIRAHSSPNDTVDGSYGFAVSGIPDITGDGLGDYIVGAPLEANGGRAYVYSGSTGALIRTHQSTVPAANGRFGAAVAGLDDLTNDGKGEYAVGAPNETANGFASAGRVHVYIGASGVVLNTRISPTPEAGGEYGTSVAAVPDFNNDGRGDLVVGAPYEDPGALPVDAGRAYVYSGNALTLEHELQSGNPQAFGRFGFSVAGVPDVGGNGGGDVIVGAPLEDVTVSGVGTFEAAGRAYVFSGTGGFLAHTFREPDSQIADGGDFGRSVGGVGDTDGDGLGDVIIGAPSWPGYRAYLFAADTEVLLKSLTTPDPTGSNQYWGYAVAGVGDVNGDGLGDYAVGGWGADNAPTDPTQAGRVVLYRPLANDVCGAFADPLPYLQNGVNAFTTIGATEGDPDDGCLQFADPGPDVWFRYTATCTGQLEVSTCSNADFNTKLAVYEGCGVVCVTSTLLGCSDNAPGCAGNTSRVTVDVVAGECYRIRIGGGNGEFGLGLIELTCTSCKSADLDGNGIVDAADLGILLGAWSAAPCAGSACNADLNGDTLVNAADLGIMLGEWGGSGGC